MKELFKEFQKNQSKINSRKTTKEERKELIEKNKEILELIDSENEEKKTNKTIKFYVKNEDLNEYERESNRISYRRLIDRISGGDIWLFNNAPKLSNYDFEFEVGNEYDEETGTYTDIYQYYLIAINNYMLEKLKELNAKDVIIAWSETLEEYVLMVDHFGTSWDYVLTDIEPTEDYETADL